MGRRLLGRATGIPALLLAVVMVVLAGCGEQRSVTPAGSTGDLPDQEVSDFVLTETDEGHVLWKLYARYAATYNARNVVVARDVKVDFFDDQGERSSVLTAQEGDLNQRTHNMTARGNVVLQTTEGTRMSTEELHFLNRDQRVVVPEEQRVQVERSGDVLTGYGFESDPDLRHYEFKKQVKATLHSRPDEVPGPARSTP